jgi:RecB family exonuclease
MIRVSNSKLNTYRRCPKKYEFKYVQKLTPKAKSLALERGSWIHELLMVHADGEDWRVRHKELTKQFQNLFEEEREDLGDLPSECSRIMRSYLRTYADDAERYVVVDTEVDEIVTLPSGLRINIIIDAILEDKQNGGLWLRDYKTRKSFEDSENMMIDPQLTLYYGAAEMLGYSPLNGGQYDEIRTKAPTIPNLNKDGSLSKRKDVDTDVFTYMSVIRKHGLDPSDYAEILALIARRQKGKFFRRTTIPQDPPVIRTTFREAVMTANSIMRAEATGQFPRTFDKSCSWGCEYKDLCITQLYGGNIKPIIKSKFMVRKRDEPVGTKSS